MPTNLFDPPKPNELEVSLFGSGYGEAIAVHLGQGNWILVDSYQDPDKSLAHLEYLYRLQVNIADAVKLVVATHWHDDHIKGIGEVFSACAAADFVLSSSLMEAEFLELVSLGHLSGIKQTSGVEEFKKVLDICERKNRKYRLASVDKTLFLGKIQLATQVADVKVCALSPSDDAVVHALRLFAQQLPQQGIIPKRLSPISPNYTSVVLWIEAGERRILLGGDLEVESEPSTGWTAILDHCITVQGNTSVFKVPHHGSKNAHADRVWSQLLCSDPYAILTPYNRGRSLPTSSDVERITNLTPNAYSSTRKGPRGKIKNPAVRRSLDEATKQVVSMSRAGHIRLRCDLNTPGTDWIVEIFASACHLSELK